MFLKTVAILVGVVVVLVAAGGVWLVFIAGPPVSVVVEETEVVVETTFLGEYFIGSSLIEVVAANGEPVLRIVSPTAACISYRYRFAAGPNDVPAIEGGQCAVEVPRGSATFILTSGESYRFTVIGNNGFGHLRRSTRRFRIPPGAGGASSNLRVKLPVRPVRTVACATAAPVRPAADAQRYAHSKSTKARGKTWVTGSGGTLRRPSATAESTGLVRRSDYRVR